MELAELKRYYNRCADEVLQPGDPRYVDIDGARGSPRGRPWLEPISRQLELSDEPLRLFATSLPGTGTSTELWRLAQQLGRPDGAHQLVVFIDAEEVIDLSCEIDVSDLLIAVVAATERRVEELEGTEPEHAHREGYLQRLWHWLTTTTIGLEAETPAESSRWLLPALKTQSKLRDQVRNALEDRRAAFLSDVRETLVSLERRAQAHGYQRITVLFDSLERLHGSSTSRPDVLRSAERVFTGASTDLRLPVHVLYMVPPALRARGLERIDLLPVVKLHDIDGASFDPGFEVMRELVVRRVPEDGLAQVLGTEYESRIRDIIGHSGGHPRALVRMLRDLLILPCLPATDEDLDRLLMARVERYGALVTLEDLRWLSRVEATKTLVMASFEDVELVDRALGNGLIHAYSNGKLWYDVNPALKAPGLLGRPQPRRPPRRISGRPPEPAEIDGIEIQGFKSIEQLRLALGRVTVLIGENGCGKSNILEAIAFASAAFASRLDHEFLASRGIRMTSAELMHPAFPRSHRSAMRVAVRSRLAPPIDVRFREEPSATLALWDAFVAPQDEPRSGPEASEILARYAFELERFLVFSPESSALRAFQQEGQILPLGINGEGLFSHLRALRYSGHTDVLAEINRRLELIDWFTGFEIPGDLGPGEHRLDIRDRFLDPAIPLDQRSANEGFLFLLFYFTLLVSPDAPPFFAVDNIDASLNPRLCARLMSDVVELAKRYDRRVIATTHNPAVLDGLDLEDPEQRLVVVSRDQDGATRVRRVTPRRPVEGAPDLRLSEAFVRGYLGGLPDNF